MYSRVLCHRCLHHRRVGTLHLEVSVGDEGVATDGINPTIISQIARLFPRIYAQRSPHNSSALPNQRNRPIPVVVRHINPVSMPQGGSSPQETLYGSGKYTSVGTFSLQPSSSSSPDLLNPHPLTAHFAQHGKSSKMYCFGIWFNLNLWW